MSKTVICPTWLLHCQKKIHFISTYCNWSHPQIPNSFYICNTVIKTKRDLKHTTFSLLPSSLLLARKIDSHLQFWYWMVPNKLNYSMYHSQKVTMNMSKRNWRIGTVPDRLNTTIGPHKFIKLVVVVSLRNPLQESNFYKKWYQ